MSINKNENDFNNAIGLAVAEAVNGRAILVFFESEARLQAWKGSEYGQRVPPGIMDSITSDTRNIDMKVLKATHSGSITLLSREHGRGLDFHCTDKKVDQLGGLHVVQTFLSEALSEEIQIRGRTARQKNKGSFHIILNVQDLDKFGITAGKIELKEKGIFVPVVSVGTECSICLQDLKDVQKLACGHRFCGTPKNCIAHWLKTNSVCLLCCAPAFASAGASVPSASQQTMYKFFHARRKVFLEESSETRREQVVCAKILHDETLVFQTDLVMLSENPNLAQKKEKCLKFLVGRNVVRSKCQLMCLSGM